MTVYKYDQVSDTFNISFFPGENPKTAVKLTYDILFRFNPEERRAIGVIILNYSDLIKKNEISRSNDYISLTGLNDLDPDWQKSVILTLRSHPATDEIDFIDSGIPCIRFKHLDAVSQRLAA